MRHLFTSLMLLMLASVTALAAGSRHTESDGIRVILKADTPFNTVILNSALTVEITVDDRYAGYIVYYKDREDAPRLQCIKTGDALLINGNAEASGVCSRVTVVCGHELANVINNSSGRIVYPKAKDKLQTLNLVNNGSGDIGIRRSDIPHLNLVNNGSGRIGVKKACADSLNIVNNDSGKVFVGGKASNASYYNNGSGLITANRTKVRHVNTCVNGSGNIRCRYTDTLSAFIIGSGKVLYYSRNGKPGKNVTAGGTTENAIARIVPDKFDKK